MSTSEKNRAVGQDNPSKNQHKPSPRTRLSSPISTSEVIGKIESFEFDCEWRRAKVSQEFDVEFKWVQQVRSL